ncbi:MAG: HlyD family efflux transporter periplasmic adaptor subunit [Lachnospiraceae bacterium]
MAKKRKNVNTGFHGKRNPGYLVFIVLFVYLLIALLQYFSKEHISSYQVTEGRIVENMNSIGLVLRNETVVTASEDGYINYYVRDGERVANEAPVYSLDETGQAVAYLEEQLQTSDTLSEEAYSDIQHELSSFVHDFDCNNYTAVYDLKYQISNQILECTTSDYQKEANKLLKKAGLQDSLKPVCSSASGVVSYSIDGYEQKAVGQITREDFNTGHYQRNIVQSSSRVENGDPVYRIIQSDDWHIITQMNEANYEALKEREYVTITIQKDHLSIPAEISFFENADGDRFADLKMKSYMVRYMNDRFLDIELTIKSATGLKVPNTALIEKECYKVPTSFIINGGGVGYAKFSVMLSDKNGKVTRQEISPSVYRIENDICYLNPNDLSSDCILINNDGEQLQPVAKEKITGVYCVNMGYATFRPVRALESNAEFTIIQENEEGSISNYDHIILNSNSVKEDQLIY